MKYSDISKLSVITRLTLGVDDESRKGAFRQTVYAKHNDTQSRYLEVTLKAGKGQLEIPYDAIARLRCIKPDGTTVLSDGCIHEGKIYVEVTKQVIAAPGQVIADIAVFHGKSVLSAASFIIDVREAPYDEEKIVSTDEFSALDEALVKVGNINSYQQEVSDIRKGYEGTEYDKAGDAVRGQAEKLIEEMDRRGPQPSNLWDSENAIDGSYVNWLNGLVMANSSMVCCDFIKVRPGAVYSYANTYIQGAFYDANKSYISGFSCNFEYGEMTKDISQFAELYPSKLNQTVTAPDNAAYVRVSTRLGNRNVFIFAETAIISKVDGTRELTDAYIPKSHVVEEISDVIYDDSFAATNATEMVLKDFTCSGGWLHSSTGNAIVRYAKYTAMDRSRISAIFKTGTASKIRFGYSSGSAYGVSSTPGNAFCVEIDTAARTMAAFNWDGNKADSKVQMGNTVSFDFEIANGAEHYIEIEKRTVNEVNVRLFRADCPGEIAEMNIKATESASNSNIYTGYMRCWGGGTFQLMSGQVSVKRMTMRSTGNQYARTMVVGDSFVEHGGRNPLCGYAQRMYETTGGNVFIDGRGGAKADDLLRRLVVSLNCCHPQYVVLNIGVNDSTAVTADEFKENLQKLIGIVESKNAIPVLITIPRRGDHDNLEFMRQINPWIKSSGYRYIDLAAVLSTGDSETQDTDKFIADKIHPNIAGGEACYRYIEANLPELIRNAK